jgi:hypothetical protein
LKSLPKDEYHGVVQPCSACFFWISANGARETSTKFVPRPRSCATSAGFCTAIGAGAAAAHLVPAGAEHHVLHDQLRLAVEQVREVHDAVRALEDVVLLDPDHRQPPPVRVEPVAIAGRLLLPGQQVPARLEPLLAGDDLG